MEYNNEMQIVTDIGELIHFIGFIGWVIATIVLIFLLYRKDASWAARIYAFGGWMTFSVMRFPFGYFYIYIDELNIVWDSPLALIGLIGGYGLIAISLLQYRSDRKNAAVN